MKFLFRQTLGVVFAGFVLVSVQAQPRNPSVGYVHPAGGQRGTKITIEIAGQNLRRVESVQVSGGGVKVLSVRTGAAFTQRLRNHFRAIRDQRTNAVNTLKAKRAEALKAAGTMEEEAEGMTMEGAAAKAAAEEEEAKKKKGGMRAQREPLPLRHLAFPKLESMKMWELRRVSMMFTPPTAPQINRQISECALVEIEIAPDAKPGDRELRIFTARGVSNPMCFQVGTIPEVHEIEPNNTKAPDGPPQKTPFLLNGQILPGDIDRLRFEARKGQKLVVQTFARHLVPFLADAVPGWFQATVALYDEKGREVAYADDFRFDPDPVLLYDVPATGVYELEIRDSIYRGREDFVYRISVGELPFITRMFPLGGKLGGTTVAVIDGWNLPGKAIVLDTRPQPGDSSVRQTGRQLGEHISNSIPYAVDDVPEISESEPNDDRRKGAPVTLPVIVNGRIGSPKDRDVFRFRGKKGQQLVAQVQARRLRSPLDSLIRLFDSAGTVLAWNDDMSDKVGFLHRDMGTNTHHADSYLRVELPADGLYRMEISDTQAHGGAEYGYRLRIGAPEPDFSLRICPSSVAMTGGQTTPLTVHVLRRDGFAGPIQLSLRDAPKGFLLQGGRIPRSCDRTRVTLTAPRKGKTRNVSLHFEGRAKIAGESVVRAAVPADNVMQAFLWRHLVTTDAFSARVKGAKWAPPPVHRVGEMTARVTRGGTVQVSFKRQMRKLLPGIEYSLSDPPPGLTIENADQKPGLLTLTLRADAEAAKVGAAGNLIVNVFKTGMRGKSKKKKKWRWPIGVLPPIPLEIIAESPTR